MTTATHTDRAHAVARATGWDIDGWASDHDWASVGIGPVGQHRDSGCLERSNWDAVYSDLREQFPDSVDSVTFGHWGHGWVEELSYDASRPDVCAAVDDWALALADYPIADEMAFCQLEHEESVESIGLIAYSATRDDIPADWAEQVYSGLFNAGEDCSPEGMRGDRVLEIARELGFLEPEDD